MVFRVYKIGASEERLVVKWNQARIEGGGNGRLELAEVVGVGWLGRNQNLIICICYGFYFFPIPPIPIISIGSSLSFLLYITSLTTANFTTLIEYFDLIWFDSPFVFINIIITKICLDFHFLTSSP